MAQALLVEELGQVCLSAIVVRIVSACVVVKHVSSSWSSWFWRTCCRDIWCWLWHRHCWWRSWLWRTCRRDDWCWLWHRNWLWRTIFCHGSTRWIDFGRVAHDDYGSSYRVHGSACRRRRLRLSIYSLVVKATYESSCYRLTTSFVILCSGFIQHISSSLLKKK